VTSVAYAAGAGRRAYKGIDLFALPGPLGFGWPRLCVQVKSADSPVDLTTLNQLVGAMENVQAGQGLLVSWGGFKSSVE
jgi:restriction system protein